ncbi:MAG: hypothetical protein K6C40_02860 [Thermoguttaceae bacterium]|nr:hypothetical protein [Thermoguttaceae bacterium]
MNDLAVIIPYHSTPAELESSLLSLLENRPENCEICVVLDHPYENIYELSEEEVHFMNAAEEITAENRSVLNCMRLGLTACDSTYVYMMPAGVQFHSEWLAALEFLDQDEELKAFFLDPNLTQGGFFRKSFLDSFLQSSEDPGLGAESDEECFRNLVTLMQEADLPCGLLEIEFVDETPETQMEVKPEPEEKLEPNPEPEAVLETVPEPEIQSEFESETSPRPEPVQAADLSAKPGIWSNICALLRRFFKSGNF